VSTKRTMLDKRGGVQKVTFGSDVFDGWPPKQSVVNGITQPVFFRSCIFIFSLVFYFAAKHNKLVF